MDETMRISGSPREEPSGGSKRKRKVLSCYDCRRRKLRCDRRHPSCSRCQRAGQADSCSYDEWHSQPRHPEPSSPLSPKQSKPTAQAPLEWSSPTPLPHLRQISQMESRPSTLKASQTSGTWQLLGVSSAMKTSKQRPAVSADNKLSFCSPLEAIQPETVIFRGENFKTQYYGGSNPTSIIAHVGYLSLLISMNLMNIVSRTSIVYEGGYHAPLFSCTRPTRVENAADEMES
jgi:hypothetical protein